MVCISTVRLKKKNAVFIILKKNIIHTLETRLRDLTAHVIRFLFAHIFFSRYLGHRDKTLPNITCILFHVYYTRKLLVECFFLLNFEIQFKIMYILRVHNNTGCYTFSAKRRGKSLFDDISVYTYMNLLLNLTIRQFQKRLPITL